MKKVRAYNNEGQFVAVLDAEDVTEQTRRDHEYKCLDPDCGATFHWVKPHKRDENTKEIKPTFARNSSSEHKEGCDYDYEVIAREKSDISFYKDGRYSLRVNFPMGGSWTDINPRRGRLTRKQREVAETNTGKKSVGSVSDMVKFLEKQFGSLENPALDNLFLDYQGRSYPWRQVFTGADSYSSVFNAASVEDDKQASVLAVVRPLHRLSNNASGKSRFQCAFQYASANGNRTKLAPVLVTGNDSVTAALQDSRSQTKIVVARPFMPNDMRETVLARQWRGQTVPVYMYVVDPSQVTAIDNRYWKNPVPTQMSLGFQDPAPVQKLQTP